MNLGLCAIATAIVLQAGNAGNVGAAPVTVQPQEITACNSQYYQDLLRQICDKISEGDWDLGCGDIIFPTVKPTTAPLPTVAPTTAPTIAPTTIPTAPLPTAAPTTAPTIVPTTVPLPTVAPTTAPTIAPTTIPTAPLPTAAPTTAPSIVPTTVPLPTVEPTTAPLPTAAPTTVPKVAPTAAPTVTPDINTSTAHRYGVRITELVNEHRVAAGLKKVEYSAELSKPAQVRAAEIQKSFAHTRPDGRYFSSILTDFGIPFRSCGENIAWGQKSPEEVVAAWMNSAGHRANILNSGYTKLGVGYEQNERGVNYFTQLFTN